MFSRGFRLSGSVARPFPRVLPAKAVPFGQQKVAGSGTMEFIVSDRASIEAGVIVRTAYIVISIRDPDEICADSQPNQYVYRLMREAIVG